ncbi:transposase [Bacillus sp. AK128]
MKKQLNGKRNHFFKYMGRKRRIWIPEAYHHVYNRGHNRQNIFHDETDMNALFTILEMIHQQYTLSICTYCIMTNHYHLLLKTEKTHLSAIIRIMQKHYADYYNKRYKRSGAVFDQRFKSKPFTDPYSLLTVSRYIHRNPIRTKIPMVKQMEHYPYSSYKFYKNIQPINYFFFNDTDVIRCFNLPEQQTLEHYCLYIEERGEEEDNYLE